MAMVPSIITMSKKLSSQLGHFGSQGVSGSSNGVVWGVMGGFSAERQLSGY